MKKNINLMLRKCKTLSRQLVRTNSSSSSSAANYTALRSKSSTTDRRSRNLESADRGIMRNSEPQETVYVGSSRKRYVINAKYLSHPLVNALLDKKSKSNNDDDSCSSVVIKCEVVLFDHLLWMLENSDLNQLLNSSDSLDELAGLYLS